MVDEAEYQRVCEELRNIKSEIDCFKETHEELLEVLKKSNTQLASQISGLTKRNLELEVQAEELQAEIQDYEIALESMTIERDEALEQIESAREQIEGMFEL